MVTLDKHDDLNTNIKFLKLIEEHECLWKHNLPDYANSNVKVQAWKNIAKAINGTAERCSRRWRYIRQTYSQYVRSSYRNGAKKSAYYLSPHVDFVKPYVKLHPCFKSIDSSKSDQNKDGSQDGCTETPITQINIPNDLRNQKATDAETEQFLEQQFLELIEGNGETDISTKKRDDVIDEQSAKASSSSTNLKRKIEIPYTVAPKEKHSKKIPLECFVSKNWMFLESILPFVDEMSKKQIRRFRRKVMLLINEVLQNNHIDKPELVK